MNCKRGDVWIVDLGKGVGSEQSRLRPCVIIQNDVGNEYSRTTIVCPITTRTKGCHLPTHVDVEGLLVPSTVMCEQIKVIDKSRLTKMVAKIEKMDKVDKALQISIGLLTKE